MTSEEKARQEIDAQLTCCGWAVQTKDRINLSAGLGVAVCELSFATGEPDYTLFVDGKAIGTTEAKPAGATLSGVEEQSTKYVSGVPSGVPAWKSPLPFCYESTGAETFFTNRLDPAPRSRRVFSFHRPETLLAWMQQEKQLAQRLREMPPLAVGSLWLAQIQAITGLEKSFATGLLRALVQMATGSGKTFTAVNFIYRLVKYAGAKRVLFLVDRGNLGRQTLKEFQQFVSPVNNYKFTEEYIVQHLTGNSLDKSARVVIGTIQRIYSMLKGEKEPAPDLDDLPIEAAEALFKQPVPVDYNPAFPIEEFDFIITDECHRSIYNLWRQVLEYFDASLIGLTATPSKQTFGFFQQNLVMEYNHEKAVADGVNVGCDIYRIKTTITEGGSKVDAGFFVDKRDRQTRKLRWEQLDEVLAYEAADLDREVVAPDQIRTVLTTFRDRVFTDMFPGRADLPKTLIFAKDDTHADDIVRICREVFGKGNDFCQKITYRTGFVRIVEKKQPMAPVGPVPPPGGTAHSTYDVGPVPPPGASYTEPTEMITTWKRASSLSPEEILSAFRNSYFPRIAVTVDMIATGTDIKPLEIVFFMRVPLEKKPTVSFAKLLDAAALGTTEVAAIESLAGRLVRLERRFDAEVAAEVVQTAKGQSLSQIAKAMLDAVDPDKIQVAAVGRLPSAGAPVGPVPSPGVTYAEPTPAQIRNATEQLIKQALAPLATNPDLRNLLKKIQKAADQTIDIISRDTLIYAGPAQKTKQTSSQLASSFREYIEQHKAEITALQILYSRPYRQRLTEPMLKELEKKLRDNHAAWTEDRLWDAFAATTPAKVKGRSQAGRFADLVALVRFALKEQPVLEPFAESVTTRFNEWLMDKAKAGVKFSIDQLAWLNLIRDHIATAISIEPEDLELSPFNQHGGLGKAHQLFGEQLPKLLDELNEVLAA